MRFALSLVVLSVALHGFSSATGRPRHGVADYVVVQDEKIEAAIKQKLAAIKFVQLLQDGKGGFASGPKDLNPTLKATSAAVRAFKYLTGKKALEAVPNAKLHTEYVLSCYDPKTGGFADTPGGKPDLYTSAVGVMAAVELEIPKEKLAKCMDYLKENAKSFEDVRIAGAAVEAWGLKDCPFELDTWFKIAKDHAAKNGGLGLKDGGAREFGSTSALLIRLGSPPQMQEQELLAKLLCDGQRDDGGFGRKDAKGSDLETTYRVMRAFHLLKARPGEVEKLRGLIAKCRNVDGGFGVKPGDPSTVAGTYFATIIAKWLDETE
jgi:hypothetical protein